MCRMGRKRKRDNETEGLLKEGPNANRKEKKKGRK